jgi:hypothetical protein
VDVDGALGDRLLVKASEPALDLIVVMEASGCPPNSASTRPLALRRPRLRDGALGGRSM